MNTTTEEYLRRELRCQNCRYLLAKERIFSGFLEIVCRRCKETNNFTFKSLKSIKQENAKLIINTPKGGDN